MLETTTDWALASAILGMTVATYLTRAGGVWMMRFVRLSRPLESFLRNLASSVFIAIVLGGAVRGDAAAWIAIAVGIGVMALFRAPTSAVAAGVVAAAGWRWFWGA